MGGASRPPTMGGERPSRQPCRTKVAPPLCARQGRCKEAPPVMHTILFPLTTPDRVGDTDDGGEGSGTRLIAESAEDSLLAFALQWGIALGMRHVGLAFPRFTDGGAIACTTCGSPPSHTKRLDQSPRVDGCACSNAVIHVAKRASLYWLADFASCCRSRPAAAAVPLAAHEGSAKEGVGCATCRSRRAGVRSTHCS